MEVQEQNPKSKVVKVDSKESWEFHLNQATVQASPIVAHFSAIWCIPSVAMNPFMEELANTYPDILFLSIDVDDVKVVDFNEWLLPQDQENMKIVCLGKLKML